MGLVVYQCDTCNRTIDLVQNKHGLETIGRCIITNACRGKLVPIKTIADHSRGSIPTDVAGLDNWQQRRILHTHEQEISSSVWHVIHDLNTEPSIQTFVYVQSGATEILTEITPTKITTISANETQVEFPQNYKGIAQSIARSSTARTIVAATEDVGVLPMTTSNKLVIATFDASTSITLVVQFLSPVTGKPSSTANFVFTTSPSNTIGTAWANVKKVLIHGKLYTVRGLDISGTIPTGLLDGSPFYVTSATPSTLFAPNRTFVLLTKPPYAVEDRNTTQYIDITTVSSVNASQGFYYEAGEMYAYEPVKETAYPPIIIAS